MQLKEKSAKSRDRDDKVSTALAIAHIISYANTVCHTTENGQTRKVGTKPSLCYKILQSVQTRPPEKCKTYVKSDHIALHSKSDFTF